MMSTQKITVNSRKYDQSIRRSWKCELMEQSGKMLVFGGIFADDVTHTDLGYIKRGTISYEYYWLDRWYNVFRFHEPNGEFRNYYCNINMPPKFANGVLDYVDLDIDVLVWPGSTYKILDEAEYEENALKFEYPEAVRSNAVAALSELIELIENHELPRPDKFVQQITASLKE